jgi:hypothetical protein
MTSPHTLCAQALKGRYYLENDFLQAVAPQNTSATWRAIVAGREALQLRMIKRVGDGSSVAIWHDKWIPEIETLQPSAQMVNMERNDPHVGEKKVRIRREWGE